jgi:hypothetical protein
MDTPLSVKQVEFFRREGYLVAPGLIDQDLVSDAEAALWEHLGADPDQPETWPKDRLWLVSDDVFLALYTPALCAAYEQLTGYAFVKPSDMQFAHIAFPSDEPWSVDRVHVDNAVESWNLKTFPPTQRGTTLIYLNDVEPHGGGTAVWPRWHKTLVELMQDDPERYELLYSVQAELMSGVIDLGDPIELTPDAGDVILDTFLPHSGTHNVSRRPRFAMQHAVLGDQAWPPEMNERQQVRKAKLEEYFAEQRKLGRKRAYATSVE